MIFSGSYSWQSETGCGTCQKKVMTCDTTVCQCGPWHDETGILSTLLLLLLAGRRSPPLLLPLPPPLPLQSES